MARLLVYLHLALKQRALQDALQSALGNVDVTAVGRIADFDRALGEGQDAVLTLPLILNARGLSAKSQGSRNGEVDEPYVLAAVDREPRPQETTSVGALDLLGRLDTTNFVHSLVGASPKVERVTKAEDLLPLLQMQRVACICLSQTLFVELKADSRMNLVPTLLPRRVGLPALCPMTTTGTAIVAKVRELPEPVRRRLGVDAWR